MLPATKETDIGNVTATSWSPGEDMSFSDWERIGVTLQGISGSINWWIGDWLNFGEHRYGEMYAQAVETTGWAVQRLKDAKWVSANVPKSLRNDNLMWTHHRHVAHMDVSQQEYWLNLAEETSIGCNELRVAIREAGMESKSTHQLIHSSQSNERYTPPDIISSAYETLEKIDLDPASCELANQCVKANKIYTIDDDGLSLPWEGKVWLNPPYGFRDGKSNQELWSTRLISAYKSGCVDEALLLVNSATGERWFQSLWDYPICFVGYRLKFIDEDGVVGTQPTHSSAIVYIGLYRNRFAQAFRRHGAIVQQIA